MKKVSIYFLFLGLFLINPFYTKAQQWFVKSFEFSSSINQIPDYRTSGTYVTTDVNEQGTGVLVFGTMGYTQNELSGSDGGFGNADGIVLFNDVLGDNQWAITIGSQYDDIISRVVEDSDGKVIISGYTVTGSGNVTFLAKYDPASASLDWVKSFGVGTPTDLINVNAYGKLLDTEGYAVSGNLSGGKAFIYYVNASGSKKWAQQYQPMGGSGNLDFNSIIQLKTYDAAQGSLPIYGSHFAVAGANNGSGYVARIKEIDGSISNDFKASNHYEMCSGTSTPSTYVSLDQWQDGDVVAFGQFGKKIHLTAFEDPSAFTIKWNRSFYGSAPNMSGLALDINATAFGYLGVFQYSGTLHAPFLLVEYDFDGNIKRWESLEHMTNFNTEWYFSRELNGSLSSSTPHADFSMECGKAFHFSGTETYSPNPPANWSPDRIPHVRIRLNTESCVEVPFTMSENFCEEYFVEATGPDAEWTSTTTNVVDYNVLGTSLIDPSPEVYCESDCPQSACVNPFLSIANSDLVILEAGPGYSQYLWSNGFTSQAVSVSVRTRTDVYSVDQTDSDGCITTAVFFVVKGKKGSTDPSDAANEIKEISLYPNPATGILNVEIPQDGLSLEIFDTMGKLVKKVDNLNTGSHQLDISEYANGLFTVRVFGNGINTTIKLNKN